MKISRPAMMLAAAAIGVSLTLAGCTASTPTADTGKKQTITYWGWDGAPGQAIVTKEIAGFEKANPNITVKYTEIPQADYKAKAALALSAGENIDVLTVQPGTWAQTVESYLLPVSKWDGGAALKKQFTPSSVEQTSRLFTGKKLLAVPLYLSGSAIGVYNADILKSVNIDPPKDVADFAKLSDALKAQGKGILPVVMPSDGWFQDEAALTVVGQTDKNFFNTVRYDKGKWDTPGYQKGLTAYKALYDDGTFDVATLDLPYAQSTAAFDAGKAAVMYNGSWETGRILKGNYGIIPFPAQDSSNDSLRSFLDVTLGITSASKHQAAAEKFIAYMSAGAGVDDWASVLQGIPAVSGYKLPAGTLTTQLQKDSYAEMVKLIENPHSDRNNMGAFSDAVGANVKEVVLGHMSVKDAAADDQKKLEAGNF